MIEPERSTARQRKGKPLSRPRSRREQAALSDWDRFGIDDPLEGPVVAGDVAETAAPESAPLEPTTWDDGPVSPKVGKVDGTPVRRGPARRKPRRRADSDPHVKLDIARRREVRRLARGGMGAPELAERFSVDVTVINDLLRGRSHAGDNAKPIPPPPRETIGQRLATPPPDAVPYERIGGVPGTARLTPEERAEIRRLSREEGWGLKRLSRRFGVSRGAIQRLLRGAAWRDDPGAAMAPPRPNRWEDPTGTNRSRRGNDADGDLVMPLEAPAAAELPAAGPAEMPTAATDVDEDWGEVPYD